MSIKIEVWGDYACFSRPEMKVERVSYDVITPSAARGLVEAIYWHPGLQYHIDRIYLVYRQAKVRKVVMKIPSFCNGNSSKMSGRDFLCLRCCLSH